MMIHDDSWWYLMMNDDTLWYMMIHNDYMMIHDDKLGYMMMHDDTWWCMTIHDDYVMIHDDTWWWYMMMHDDAWWFLSLQKNRWLRDDDPDNSKRLQQPEQSMLFLDVFCLLQTLEKCLLQIVSCLTYCWIYPCMGMDIYGRICMETISKCWTVSRNLAQIDDEMSSRSNH
jgi:hypothetical protein